MLLIGLTGSIGMGKSATAQIFRDLGVPVHDADQAVHDIYRASGREAVRALFPEVVDEAGVDRAKLARIVLSDPAAMKRLEAVIHPLVVEHRRAFVAGQSGRGVSLVVCDVPLLFETESDRDMDLVVVASASAAVQKARVMSRDGMTEERFSAILSKQLPDAQKRRRAHMVLDTGHGFDAARRQVVGLLRALSGRVHKG